MCVDVCSFERPDPPSDSVLRSDQSLGELGQWSGPMKSRIIHCNIKPCRTTESDGGSGPLEERGPERNVRVM